MTITLIVLLIISILLNVYLVMNLSKSGAMIKQLSTLPPGTTPEVVKSDMQMVYDALDRCICKVLYSMNNTDHTFTDNSSVKSISATNYRGLIDCLVRGDIYISDDGQTTLFSVFSSKVYLMYLAETSPAIKNIFYKYYSGFNIENYKKKGVKPSVLSFVNEYVRTYVWRLSLENIDADKRFMEESNGGSASFQMDSYTTLLEQYNQNKYRELCDKYFNIYNNSYKPQVEEQSKPPVPVVIKN